MYLKKRTGGIKCTEAVERQNETTAMYLTIFVPYKRISNWEILASFFFLLKEYLFN